MNIFSGKSPIREVGFYGKIKHDCLIQYVKFMLQKKKEKRKGTPLYHPIVPSWIIVKIEFQNADE